MSNELRTKATMPETISMYEHEEEMFRMERHSKRLWIAILVLVLACVISNGAWLIYQSMYDTISYSQDGEGINNINTGTQGDLIDGAETQNQDSQGSQSQGCENP